jgi:hypothetical protein
MIAAATRPAGKIALKLGAFGKLVGLWFGFGHNSK